MTGTFRMLTIRRFLQILSAGLVCVPTFGLGQASATQCENECSGHGECSSEGGCTCETSWVGHDCSFFLDLSVDEELAEVEVVSGTCQDGCSGRGQCEAGVCLCNEGFFGPSCSDAKCPNDCGDHGSCSEGKCLCNEGWLGHRCEMQASVALLDDSASIHIPAEGVEAGIATTGESLSEVKTLLNESLHEVSKNDGRLRYRRASKEAKAASDIADSLQKWARMKAAKFRLNRAVMTARRNADKLPGHEFSFGVFAQKHEAEHQTCKLGCSGHGSCDDATGACLCNKPWTGALCDISECPQDCSGNGMCMFGKCVCGPDFFGVSCEQQRCPQDCSGHGYCFEGKCMCSSGFGGSSCLAQVGEAKVVRLKLGSPKAKETKLSSHSSSSSASQMDLGISQKRQHDFVASACPAACSNKGTCVEGACLCNDGYQGSDCSILSICSGNGRLTSSLLESGESIKTCICDEGFAGRDCERQMMCADATCSGHGVCQQGRCTCDVGFSGHSCHIAMLSNRTTLETATRSAATGKEDAPMTVSWMQPAKWISAASPKPQFVETQIKATLNTPIEADKFHDDASAVWHPALVPEEDPAMPSNKVETGALLTLLNARSEVSHPAKPSGAPVWKEALANQSFNLDTLLEQI